MQKLKLKKDTDLQLYLFIARATQVNIPAEKVTAILAYNLETATLSARKEIPDNWHLNFHGQTLAVNKLLDVIEQPQQEPAPSLVMPSQTSKEQFVNNLKLCCDKFVQGDDKQNLKKIINKIKV